MSNEFEILKNYPEEQYNQLLPFTDMELAPYHQIAVQRIKLSPDPQDGDVYALKSRRVKRGNEWVDEVELYAIARRGLDRLVHAAGGRWSPTALDRNNGDSVTAQVHLALLSPDGQWQTWPGTYTWDIAERSDAARYAHEKDLKAGPPNWWKKSIEEWRDQRSERLQNELQSIRRFATSRAETGAMLRAARKALGIKGGYTPAELDKEFALLRVTVNIYELPSFAQAAVSVWMGQQLAPFGAPQLPNLAYPFRPMIQKPREAFIDPMSDAAFELAKQGPEPQPEPEPDSDLPVSKEEPEAKHWIDDTKIRARFWRWARQDLALSDADVHQALRVEHVRDFAGTPIEAKARILGWVDAQAMETEAA